MAPATRPLNRKHFNLRLRKMGFRQTATLGVWRLPVPVSGVRVDERHGGPELRGRLSWMMREHDRALAAYLAGGDK